MRRAFGLGLALIVILLPAPVASATFPGRNGQLVYALDSYGRYREDETALETVDGRGRSYARIYLCDDRDFGSCQDHYDPHLPSPRYSPDGTRIAFGAVARAYDPFRPQYGGFGVIEADGSGFDFHRAATVNSLAWSPMGDALLADTYQGLYLMSPSGDHPTLLLANGRDPDWSGDGRIAYQLRGDVWIRNRGGATRRLTRGGGGAPSWSPGGRWIAFERKGNVFLVRRDGTDLRRVTWRGGSRPVWSPDGRRFAFIRKGGLYTVGIHAGALRELIEPDTSDSVAGDHYGVTDVDWQPLPR